MKTQVILTNVASVVAFLAWLGWNYLRALSRAFGTASGGGPDIAWVFIVVAIVGTVCVGVSFFVPAGAARMVALTPIALILLGQGIIAYQERAYRTRRTQGEPGDRAAQQAKLREISRDFVSKDERITPEGRNFSFLTHDREHNLLVLIQDAHGHRIYTYCIGRIEGAYLDTYSPPEEVKESYGKYVDSEGRSIADRWTLRHRPDVKYKNSWLEKFKP